MAILEEKLVLFWFLVGVGTKKTPQPGKASVLQIELDRKASFPILVLTMHNGAPMFTWVLRKFGILSL